ncbi:hypothetical protein IOD16_23295 [Saccharothrix sp. 6-C]|uniref:hypothetical protein n=1 Tax=Saccharothrix sp. 6-C TaxID=2781735 RepID=UPI001916CC91|nr:hypothetical protein [Saccharothrix sp. 6-C]QQQ74139.1 hypothetical protein IOD16_23295 [Saccharothrix sp. 6-C]
MVARASAQLVLGALILTGSAMILSVLLKPPVVGMASPQWELVSPVAVQETAAKCDSGRVSRRSAKPATGPVMTRSNGFVVVIGASNQVTACVRTGAYPSAHTVAFPPDYLQTSVLMSAWLDDGAGPVGYGAVRSDVAAVVIHFPSGRMISAQVSDGFYLADLHGLSHDELHRLSYQAFDAAGTMLTSQ